MTDVAELAVNALGGIATDVVSWVLTEVGLAGTVSVGLVFTAGMYLWWGYRLHTVLSIFRSVGITASKHLVVSLALVGLTLGALVWSGIVPTVNIGAALDLVEEVIP